MFLFTRRFITTSPRLYKIVPFKLTDIGEGINEVQIIKWYGQFFFKIHGLTR